VTALPALRGSWEDGAAVCLELGRGDRTCPHVARWGGGPAPRPFPRPRMPASEGGDVLNLDINGVVVAVVVGVLLAGVGWLAYRLIKK